jgi:hypothetical protein
LFFFSVSIFFSNTLFSFFFNIEVLAILMSYFISSSKEFFLFNKDNRASFDLKSKKKKNFLIQFFLIFEAHFLVLFFYYIQC